MALREVSKLLAIALLGAGLAAPLGASTGHSSAYLGVMVDKVAPETAEALHLANGTGALIAGVDQDGPACRAGLKNGDVVVAYNGKTVDGPEQFAGMIHSSTPGKTAAITVFRDGRKQEVKVTLGDWKQMAAMPRPPVAPSGSMAMMGPMPPVRVYPDIDIPRGATIAARQGIVVEPLTPQLAGYFGVPENRGVLVRSVDKGSPGATAGLRAGDVIVKVSNETIHDMADFRRALKGQNGKLTVGIVRDKKAQTLEMVLPANTSELKGEDWDGFNLDMQAMSDEMQKLGPEIAKNAQTMAMAIKPDRQEMEKMRQQIQESMKTLTPELQKQMEAMRPEVEKNAKQLAESMKPTQKQMEEMRREIEKSMKVMGPELQLNMEQLKKELEQQKLEMLKSGESRQEF
jgi:serine protease Do